MHWTLSDMVLDLAHNSIEAGAAQVDLTVAERGSQLRIEITDNGKGMDRDQQQRALDPFYTEAGKHPGRRVGLGLPFLVQTVDQTGGRYELSSEPGVGTRLVIEIDAGHVDAPPLGDLAGAVTLLMCFDGDYDLRLTRSRVPPVESAEDSDRVYEISRSALIEVLGDLSHVANRALVDQYLRGCEEGLESLEERVAKGD